MSDTSSANPVETDPSFQTLLLSVLPSLHKHALALTRHRADAEDLVQAAVASALAAQDSFCAGTNFNAWMTRILRNRFFSNVRRRRTIVDLDDVPPSQLGRSGGQEDNLAIQDLRRHMLRLPANQRLILLMISVDGISYEDASVYLGVAAGTLKCRVFRARAQLQLWMLGVEVAADATKAPARRRGKRPASPAVIYYPNPTEDNGATYISGC
ncbi:MAG: polymerase subunit sigma-70 [Rhodospirillales bacterium]|nr:polymerase subunit sigma-70 [Rhodospirillales bacterium]